MPSANEPWAEVPWAPWLALHQDSSPRRGLRQVGRGQRLAGEPTGHVLQHRPPGGSQMHRPGVCAQSAAPLSPRQFLEGLGGLMAPRAGSVGRVPVSASC